MSGMWVFMLCMALLLPLSMMAFGKLFLVRPPKEINCVFGYRTRRSMSSPEAWAFAHGFCGRLWLRWGAAMLFLSAAAMLFLLGRSDDEIGTFGGVMTLAQVGVMLCSIIPTEAALKKNFTEYGRPLRPAEKDK